MLTPINKSAFYAPVAPAIKSLELKQGLAKAADTYDRYFKASLAPQPLVIEPETVRSAAQTVWGWVQRSADWLNAHVDPSVVTMRSGK